MKEFAAYLRTARLRRDWTSTSVAERLGIAQSTLRGWESGYRAPTTRRQWREWAALYEIGAVPSSVQPWRPKLAPCGTPAAYKRHVKDGEPRDDACKRAHARDVARWRATKAAK